jgi:D-methionine transport system ATP-binding protein
MIELININKIFQRNQQTLQVLSNINLSIARGDIIGILGKSGAGKSTLLRIINLLEQPSSGQVIFDGCDLMQQAPAKLRLLRRKMAMIFQQFNLLQSRDVFANVSLALEIINFPKHAISARVKELLSLVGLADKQHAFPNQLSGGQQQRVAIARALACEPSLLLSDEATSALDTESTHSILQLLQDINQQLGLTIVLISHELNVIKQICHRTAVIDQGQLIEMDTTLNIFAKPNMPITKQLVQQALHFNLEQIKALAPLNMTSPSLIVLLTFLGADSELPLLTYLIKEFDITVNIRQAQIERIQDTTIGFTICELTGSKVAIERAIHYIHSTSIKIEIITHG